MCGFVSQIKTVCLSVYSNFYSKKAVVEVVDCRNAVEHFHFLTVRQFLIWDTNPHTPRLYFKPAPPLHLPRHNDLLGLHRLNMGMEKYYASPEKADAGCSPFAAAANLETL